MGTARKIRARRRADRNRAVAAAKPFAEKNDLGGAEETVAAFAPADAPPGAEKKVVGGLADFGTGEVRLRHADGSTSGDAMAPAEPPAVHRHRLRLHSQRGRTRP